MVFCPSALGFSNDVKGENAYSTELLDFPRRINVLVLGQHLLLAHPRDKQGRIFFVEHLLKSVVNTNGGDTHVYGSVFPEEANRVANPYSSNRGVIDSRLKFFSARSDHLEILPFESQVFVLHTTSLSMINSVIPSWYFPKRSSTIWKQFLRKKRMDSDLASETVTMIERKPRSLAKCSTRDIIARPHPFFLWSGSTTRVDTLR